MISKYILYDIFSKRLLLLLSLFNNNITYSGFPFDNPSIPSAI